MKSLITGGAGFIGSNLVDLLIKKKHKVIVLDNFSTGRKSNLKDHSKKNLKIINIDISKKNENLNKHFKGVNYVFHLAGLADIVPSIENPTKYFEANVIGTLNVLKASKKAKIKKLIYAASASCYGIPKKFPTAESATIDTQYPYALTKWQGEELVMHWQKIFNLPAISLRFFNCYGNRSRTTGAYGAVFGVFLAQRLAGKPLTIVGNGKQTRDFIHVSDLSKIHYEMLKFIDKNKKSYVLNCGYGKGYTVLEVIKKFQKIIQKKIKIRLKPKRKGDIIISFSNNSKIQKLINWKPKFNRLDIMVKSSIIWEKKMNNFS